mmetsp:Transcript_5655/g.5854  ORF Transcript_5655/g.5854 Transcript_5655/m.5854 type:complete len:253 (-) Transcript_5655:358-1116(-)
MHCNILVKIMCCRRCRKDIEERKDHDSMNSLIENDSMKGIEILDSSRSLKSLNSIDCRLSSAPSLSIDTSHSVDPSKSLASPRLMNSPRSIASPHISTAEFEKVSDNTVSCLYIEYNFYKKGVDITPESLALLFEIFGEVLACKLGETVSGTVKGRRWSRGYGYIYFKDPTVAYTAAKLMNHVTISNIDYQCSIAHREVPSVLNVHVPIIESSIFLYNTFIRPFVLFEDIHSSKSHKSKESFVEEYPESLKF